MLDYIAVDYAGAVRQRKVVNKEEYAEMQEFSQSVASQLKELPETPDRSRLLSAADALRSAVLEMAPSETVVDKARSLASARIAVYPIPVAPSSAPDLKQGAAIYQSRCASCHGADGEADTPLAVSAFDEQKPAPSQHKDHRCCYADGEMHT